MSERSDVVKLVAVTYGTEGDTRPLIALCHALTEAGHDVTLLADGGTLTNARDLGGLAHAPLAGDIRAALQPDAGVSSVVPGEQRLGATTRTLARLANENTGAWMHQVLDVATGCDALIVSGLAAYVGFSAAEKLDVPAIGASMIPLTPTASFPSPFLPRRVPRWLNRFSYRLVDAALWRSFRHATNAARANVGLEPGHRIWTGHPMLYGISPTLLPKPPDWPDDAWMCGQWMPGTGEWQAPRALQEFLAAGDPPIYVGFGSMGSLDQRRVLDAVVTAVAGHRALFNPGWGDADHLDLPPNFHVIDDTPHDWLLPHTSMAIHHGGSGTTHSAARAGVPSIVLPFAGDQFFWAEQLRRHGIAPTITDPRRLTAADLAQAIAAAWAPAMRARASAIGAQMRAEDGLTRAVQIIHALVTP